MFRQNYFSIHALLAESDHQTNAGSNESSDFLSTLSLRRATYDTYAKVLRVNFSIHALLAESDVTVALSSAVLTFLSTLSLRRATISMGIAAPATAIFYPRSPCGERRPRQWGFRLWGKIFYPRSPCGERRLWVCSAGFGCFFLSTLSLRRATLATW